MEIKSSLLNSDTFSEVKKSLIEVSEIDNRQDFRVDVIEFIDFNSDNNDDQFFWDMLEFVRFLNPADNSVAYTTPNHLIYLNAPSHNYDTENDWEFIYDHECLHQLWDTFAVGEEIKTNGIKYDHQVLNIASDCVINDYLSYIRKKKEPEGLINREYLQNEYGVTYDRKVDTQYSLYLKLLEHAEELKKDKRCQNDIDQNNKKNDQQEKNNGNSNSNNSKNSNSKNSNSDKENNGGKESEDKNNEKGGKNTDSKTNDKADKEKIDNNDKEKGGKGKQAGEGASSDTSQTSLDLDEIRKNAEAIIKKYQNKIGGDFGKFIEKCKSAKTLRESGLVVKVNKATSAWNSSLQSYCSAFIKSKVFALHRQYKRTYTRVKRGHGIVKFGEPIIPGKKILDNKLLIKTAFYVDRSASMSGVIDEVFEAAYIIAEGLKKQFSKDKVVEDLVFKMLAFDDDIREVKWGNKMNVGGGTCPFDAILNYIRKNTNEYMINIIITDAEFDINENKITKFLQDIDGCVIFVTNSTSSDVKEIAQKKENKLKLFYIQADNNFTTD